MKKYTIPIFSAILGSAITIAAFLVFLSGNPKSVRIEHLNKTPVENVLFTTDKSGEIIPLDFTEISANLMDVVVHIRSIQNIKTTSVPQNQQLPDPFREYFGDEFYKYFFGPQSPENQQRRNMPPRQRRGSGSGVIISSEGYIITNNHVVAEADEIEVALHDNRTYEAKIIGTDPHTDLALIKINEKDLSTIPLVNSDSVEVGEWVLAIGNPFNLNSTVTAGIVSAKSRNLNILRDQYAIESFIQTDAAINPGNSGGALVNLQGGLIGINTAIASPTGAFSGYGFAVPSNIVNKVVNDLLEYGSVQRGYLGIIIRNVTGTLAGEEDLNITEGVYVDSVLMNSAAHKAGVRDGDVITSIDGNEITKASELQELIARKRPGDDVKIKVNRAGKLSTMNAKLQSREGETKTVKKEKAGVLTDLGIELKTVEGDVAEKLNIKGGVKIINLYAGKLKRSTDIKEGFIITKVNNNSVSSVEDFIKVIDKTRGGVMLEGVYENIPGTYYYAFGK